MNDKMIEPKISVIIPIYNVEKYLRECLSSVVQQTLHDIEIICMDDGSTDHSVQIMDEYSKADTRIRVIHKTNSGYGDTMNQGIEISRGEYIAIVEPDDYIELDMFEKQYSIAKENNADVVKSDYFVFYGEENERHNQVQHLVYIDNLYGKVICPQQNKEIFYGYVANWAGIYKSSFIKKNQIKHNRSAGASYQDQGFWFQVMSLGKRVYLTRDIFYHYRQDNPNSSIASKQKVYCIFEEYHFIYEFIKKNWMICQELLGVYGHCSYSNYVYNFGRIAQEYKLEYLKRFSEEFKELNAKGHLDKSCFTKMEWQSIEMVINCPEQILISQMNYKNHVNQLVEQSRAVVIYGAGMMGRNLLKVISQENINKVKAFLVTKQEGNLEEIEGIRIVKLGSDILQYADTVCLISVTEKYQREMYEMAQHYQFCKIEIIQQPLCFG